MNDRLHTQIPNGDLEREIERLECLIECDLLDTPDEERFDRVTRIARSLFNVPIAAVSLIDLNRQWFKSKQGLDVDETERSIAFCDYAIHETSIMVVPDAPKDPRFAENPLVTGAMNIRFYAGVPLMIRDGLNIGTLCILDRVPRIFSQEQCQQLTDLAQIVVNEITLHLACTEAQSAKDVLYDAVEALPDGFVLYDENDRLVICNERFREIYPQCAANLVPGNTFEAIIRGGLEKRQYPDAIGREEDWFAERMLEHRNPTKSVEQRLRDGRWMRSMETKTNHGGTVGFRVDITELKMREAQLTNLLTTDALTGALTRREILQRGDDESKRASRYDRPLSLVYVDIDHFKSINDSYGHAAGDKALKRLTAIFRRMIRETDHFGRIGGEEFLLILPETDLNGATTIADRIRQLVETSVVKVGHHSIQITISIGVACRTDDSPFEEVMNLADRNLYKAKNGGRNQVSNGT